MHNLRLIYFKMRAACGGAAADVEVYGYLRNSYEMAWEYFEQPWSEVKASVPYRQLPMLVVDNDTRICQSGAITRFLGRVNRSTTGRFI